MNKVTSTNRPQKYTIPVSQLWLGHNHELSKQVEHYLQTIFCSNGCTRCITCAAIKNKQYHNLLWLYPEKSYTLSSLEPITQTISFALEKNQYFFFIIEKADFLSQICQNTLLKTLEEPPVGYHFILLADRKEHILTTIQSRCHIKEWTTHTTNPSTHQILFHFFTNNMYDHHAYLEEIEKNTPHERESVELLDAIVSYWLDRCAKTTQIYSTSDTQKRLQLLLKAQLQPPMPGSSKLFWKNLLLQWQSLPYTISK